MNSLTSRLNTLGTHAVTCLSAMAAVIILTSYVTPRPVPEIDLSIKSLKSFQVSWRERNDQAALIFNFQADLRPLMDWNVFGIYASVVVDYETDLYEKNEIVIWDSVITKKQKALIKKSADIAKYMFKDYGHDLRGKELSLRLKYVVMPFVGAMQAYEIVSEKTFTMPNNYTS
mmetsp:Transcript_34678/g.136703  ORF Transcript_34678/g.136703 Transcript_34678/m.136703 type:complete len:173 (-) Transcript_34678:3045-3563(-)